MENDFGGLLKVRGVKRIDKAIEILRNPEAFRGEVVQLTMLYAANKLEQLQALILSVPRGSGVKE